MKLKFTQEASNFLESFCAWHKDGKKFYFIPYVFQATENAGEYKITKGVSIPPIIREKFIDSVDPTTNITAKELLCKENLEGKFD